MKKWLSYVVAGVTALVLSSSLMAAPKTYKNVVVEHPWAKASLAGQVNGGGYFSLIKSVGVDDKLLSASSPVSGHVELHTMRMEGNVMKMAEVDAIVLPKNQAVKVAPGAYHLMFINLKQPLQVGQRFPVTLTFEKAGTMTLEFIVESALRATDAGSTHGH